jgi:hypothetical protein
VKRNYRKLSADRVRAINAKILEADKKLFLRRIRNIIITTVVLFILIIVAYAAYTWYVGNQVGVAPVTQTETIPATEKPNLTPLTPAANAAVGVAAYSFPSIAAPGDSLNISIHTLQDSTCKVSLKYNDIEVKNSDLIDKVADLYGNVSWSFTMPVSAQEGKWPTTVTCERNTKTGVYSQDIIVKR